MKKKGLFGLVIIVFIIFILYSCNGNEVRFHTFIDNEIITKKITNNSVSAIAPIKEGYILVGWYKEEECVNEFDFSLQVKSSLDLYAKWEIEKYFVYYETNCDYIIDRDILEYGSLIEEPDEPVNENYVFLGWYKDSDFFSLWNFEIDTVLDGGTTLYAKWGYPYRTIAFDTQGGSQIDDIMAYPNTIISGPTNPSKEGHNFLGWYLDVEFQEEFNFLNTRMPNNDIILYAKWEKKVINVLFYLDDGVSIAYSYTNVLFDSLIEEPVLNVTGKMISGWYLDSSRTSKWDFNVDRIPDVSGSNFRLYGLLQDAQMQLNLYLDDDLVVTKSLNYNTYIDIEDVLAVLKPNTVFAGLYRNNNFAEESLFDIKYQTVLSDLDLFIRTSVSFVDVFAEEDVSFLVASDNSIYAFGDNTDYQLGLGDTCDIEVISHSDENVKQRIVYEPRVIESFLGLTIQDIAIGNGYTLFVFEDGSVYGVGKNEYYQLGLGHNNQSAIPVLIEVLDLLSNEKITRAFTGEAHSFLLSNLGRVFAMGNGFEYQLGTSLNLLYQGRYLVRPTLISLEEKIIDISLGAIHSVLLTENNEVLVSGTYDDGQLGINGDQELFINLDGITDIVKIATGYYSTMLLNKDGFVYVFGDNNYGQLGLGTLEKNIYIPTLVPNISGVSDIITSTYHSIFVLNNNDIYVMGRNIYGSLGIGQFSDTNIISPVENMWFSDSLVTKIATGNYHSIFLDSGKVFVSGAGFYGQLGIFRLTENIFNVIMTSIPSQLVKKP